MKSFLQIAEEKEKELNPVVMAFGRMNPISAGHEKLVNKVKELADEKDVDHHIVLSHSQDSKNNPVALDAKVKHAKHCFPDANIQTSSKECRTFLKYAKKLNDAGHKHLIMVAGADRVKYYNDILQKNNGKAGYHNFDKIEVKSAGTRDPKSNGVEGVSATKMRQHAEDGNYSEFRKLVPSTMSHVQSKRMYDDTRRGMGINENVDRGLFKAIFVAGGPGSGKDIVVRQGIAEKRAVELNSVQAHDYLMDKQKLSEQSNDFRREAIRNRSPLVISCTADNFERVESIKEELEELGYSTMMVYVETSNDVSKARNQTLKRMFAESIRYEKWAKAQENKVKFYNTFEDFNLFINDGDDLVLEECLTDAYEHINEFLDSKSLSENAINWMMNNGRISLDEQITILWERDFLKEADRTLVKGNVDNISQKGIVKRKKLITPGNINSVKMNIQKLKDQKKANDDKVKNSIDKLKSDINATKSNKPYLEFKPKKVGPKLGKVHAENNSPTMQMLRKAGKVDSVKDGDVKSNSGFAFRTYESSQPTLKINPPPKEPNFTKDKEKEKIKKSKWISSPNQRIRTPGMGPEFDSRAGAQGAAAGAGLGNPGYSENVEKSNDKYILEDTADGLRKNFKDIRKSKVKEAIDDPGAIDVGLGGVLGGGGNNQALVTYKDPVYNIKTIVNKKKKKQEN